MPTVTFKSKLNSGVTLLGTFQQIPAADVTEIIGRAGIDFVIIDTEHGMFGVDAVVNVSEAADISWPAPAVETVIAGNPEVETLLANLTELPGVSVCGVTNNQGASRLQSIIY